jgi:hypothetical protein
MLRFSLALSLLTFPLAAEPAPVPAKAAKASPVFKTGEKILFESDFSHSGFGPMKISEDARYNIASPTPDRLGLVDAPGMPAGTKAACFTVPRAANRFRSELSLPHEPGFQERWYGVSQFVPADWKPDMNPGSDIVIQWHAIPGNGKATNPNLDIAIHGKKWVVHRAYGDPHKGPTRATKELDLALEPGNWSNWIIRAKWSPREDGRIEIWHNGRQVFEHTGPNAYGTIGVDYTPYLKTGIYHPEWNFSKAGREERFAKDLDPVVRKQIHVAKVVVASEAATLDDLKAALPALPAKRAR